MTLTRPAGEADDDPRARRGTGSDLLAAFALARRAAPGVLLGRAALALVVGAAPVATAWSTKVMLDLLAGPGPVPPTRLLPPTLALAVIGLLMTVAPRLAEYLDAELARGVQISARQVLFGSVGRLPGLARLEDPRFRDRLELAVTSGPAAPAQLVSGSLSIGAGAATVLGFLVSLTALSPVMALVVVVAAVPTLRAEIVLSRRRAQAMVTVSEATRREFFYADLLTGVTAAKEVRLYGLGNLFGARMATELRAVNATNRRLDRQELRAQSLLGVVGAVVAGGGLVWAGWAAAGGRLGVGDVVVFAAAVAGVQNALALMIGSIARIHRALLLFDHYRFVTRTPPDLARPSSGAARPVPVLRRGIEFRDVWFRYDETLPWVLRGLDLTLPAGRSTALVGLNGAGKSTVIKLLCRFYDPTRGAVLWDGVDLRDLPVEELRRRIGAVFQDFMEYDLSAAENIGLGDVTALGDRDRVIAAARRAGCHDTVTALPAGYDTMLSRIFTDEADRSDPTTGVVLSGGQWQRLALARALVRDRCDLLILDEPSAGLDADAEYEVHQRLRAHRDGRTSVLVSHRLNTVRDADQIVVLADGRVTQRGSHAALVATDGAYRRLFTRQAAGYRDQPGTPAPPPELPAPTGARA